VPKIFHGPSRWQSGYPLLVLIERWQKKIDWRVVGSIGRRTLILVKERNR
jgi:hypothetical protein